MKYKSYKTFQNQFKEDGIIFWVNRDYVFDKTAIKEEIENLNIKTPIRVYTWIDDQDGINQAVINMFIHIFNQQRLTTKAVGRIDTATTIDTSQFTKLIGSPRQGDDGGVVGIIQ